MKNLMRFKYKVERDVRRLGYELKLAGMNAEQKRDEAYTILEQFVAGIRAARSPLPGVLPVDAESAKVLAGLSPATRAAIQQVAYVAQGEGDCEICGARGLAGRDVEGIWMCNRCAGQAAATHV